jgi:hypothetical protein
MHPAGFETTISASERPQTHALDSAATGIGMHQLQVLTKLKAKAPLCVWIVSFSNQVIVSLLKGQSLVTHTIRQTEIPALLDSWVTITSSVKILCPQTKCLPLYFRTNITRWIVGL